MGNPVEGMISRYYLCSKQNMNLEYRYIVSTQCEHIPHDHMSGIINCLLKFRRLFTRILTSLIVLLVLFAGNLLEAKQYENKNVVILFSFRPTLPVASLWDQSIRSVFEADSELKVDVNIEYLNLSRFKDPSYLQMISDVFRYKYTEDKPDLIITVFEPAVDFILKFGEDIFPGVPVVFGGVLREYFEERHGKPGISGVFSNLAFTETLDLSLDLHPDTRRVAVILGSGRMEKAWLKAVRRAFLPYEDRLEFTYLVGLPITELTSRVASLPDDTIIIFLPVVNDRNGQSYLVINVLSELSRVSNAPIYSFWEILLDHGLVGGFMGSYDKSAKIVAEIGLGILKGGMPRESSETPKADYNYMFNWHQLKRWSIAEDQLPPGSIVRFQEPHIWDKYRVWVIGGIALFLFQLLIIVSLVYQRKVRRRAEEERERFRAKTNELQSELVHLDRIATVNTLASSMAHEINQPLTAIRSYAQAAQRFMNKEQLDLDSINKALEGIVTDNKRATSVINNLRNLAKKRDTEFESLNINTIIIEVVALLESELILRAATVVTDLHQGTIMVEGDPVQIQQILINLIANALDAMENIAPGKRRIIISTGQSLDKKTVMLKVSDTGVGISYEDIEEIFTPFETTKQKGIGLGLSICRSIIENHSGSITAQNNQSGGTTFYVELPVIEELNN